MWGLVHDGAVPNLQNRISVDCSQALIGLSRRHHAAMAAVGRQPVAEWGPNNRNFGPEPEGHFQQNPHRVAWFCPQLRARGGEQ